MRLYIVAALSGFAAIALVATGPSADAAPKKRTVSQGDVSVSSQSRARRARSRTRITVRPRSYLDGGTEVWPGERKYSDYAIPPTHSASSVMDHNVAFQRSTLPGPFSLPGRYNPYGW